MKTLAQGDTVLYGAHGCCCVDDIEQRDTGTYYVLRPVRKANTKFLVPADNEELLAKIRPLPTPHALEQTIDAAAAAEVGWIEDVSVRRDTARQVLNEGSEYEVLLLMREFSEHKRAAKAQGKRPLTSDASILRAAKDHVRDEFSLVFGIEPEEVDRIIVERGVLDE